MCCCLCIFPVFFDFVFKITSDQLINFLWLQPDSVDNMATSPPSRTAPAVFRTPVDIAVAGTAAVSTFPTLATWLLTQEVPGMSSAQEIVASPIQAVSSPARAISSPT